MSEIPKQIDEPFDPTDIEVVVLQYSNMVYRLALSRVGNIEDAEDITQEVFIRYLNHASKMESSEHQKAWLLRVCINCSINHHTSAYKRHHATLTDELAAITEDPKAKVYEEDEALALLVQLPAKYRQALHLYYYEELSVQEVATVMGSKEGTVKSLLHRGRKRLRALWEEREASHEQ